MHSTVDMMTLMAAGVVVTQRVQSAGMRAVESHARVRRLANKLSQEMDEMTGPVALPTRPSSQGDFLHEDDSLVVAVVDVIARTQKV